MTRVGPVALQAGPPGTISRRATAGELWNNDPVRGVAMLLVLTLVGPSVGPLVCDWLCDAHRQSPASGGCHETDAPAAMATLEAGHRCHDHTPSTPSILTSPTQVALCAIPVAAALPDDMRPPARALPIGPRSAAANAPPPLLIPLRV